MVIKKKDFLEKHGEDCRGTRIETPKRKIEEALSVIMVRYNAGLYKGHQEDEDTHSPCIPWGILSYLILHRLLSFSMFILECQCPSALLWLKLIHKQVYCKQNI